MACTFRLRIELPDQPGALARVAATIADQGGNVVSVDVHEIDGPWAVDEIVVDFEPGWNAPALASALAEAQAGVLLSSSACDVVVDPVVRSLQWAAAMCGIDARERDGALLDALSDACSLASAWVSPVADALAFAAGRRALERGGAVVQRADGVVGPVLPDLPTSVWLLAVPDSHLNPQHVAFLARPLSLRFTASEIARVEALMALRRQFTLAAAPAA